MDSKSPYMPDANGLVPSLGPVYTPASAGDRGISYNPEFTIVAMFDNGAVRNGNTGELRTYPIYDANNEIPDDC